jgi:integrase
MKTARRPRLGTSDQCRLMEDACPHAHVTPRITFHGLRHTWASLAVMNGVPLLVAKNISATATPALVDMVEHHYGHLAPSYIRARHEALSILKSSRANIIRGVRPLKPDRFFLFAPPRTVLHHQL